MECASCPTWNTLSSTLKVRFPRGAETSAFTSGLWGVNLVSKCPLFRHLWEHASSGLVSHICVLSLSPSTLIISSRDLSYLPDTLKLCHTIWLELFSCHPQKLSSYKPSIQLLIVLRAVFCWFVITFHIWEVSDPGLVLSQLIVLRAVICWLVITFHIWKVSDQSLVLDHSLFGNISLFGLVCAPIDL